MIGQTISHYKILEELGRGGMGVVYKARDTKLDRFVALKFLPPHLNQAEEEKKRFIHEAKAASALDHPNICTVHEIDERDGQIFISMTHIKGQSLKEKIASGPLKLDDALDIAVQVTRGLQEAHEKGVVHRDVKPANIMITAKGQVKIMDFGLAKLAGSTKLTKTGTAMGTADYMAPEQVQAIVTDHRTDVWALGVVMYEMISGQQPFPGEYEQSIMYLIVNEEPEALTALRSGVPMGLERIVNKCMAKDPNERYQHVDEIPVDLKSVKISAGSISKVSTATAVKASALPIKSWKRAFPWVLGILIGIVISLGVWSLWPASNVSFQPVKRVFISPPPTESIWITEVMQHPSLALSPDGNRLVYVARGGGIQRLYLREMDQFEAKAIPGTEDARNPFFSPDGEWVAFLTSGKLKKVSLSAGTMVPLCDVLPDVSSAGSWSTGGHILFAQNPNGGLARVSANGGTPELITVPDTSREEIGHYYPQVLPGGKGVLFTIRAGGGSWNETRIAALSLKTGVWRTLLIGGTNPRYLSTGHLVYARAGALYVVPFDLERLQINGSPVQVLEGVLTMRGAEFSLSNDGTLVYLPGNTAWPKRSLVWVDHQGKTLALPLPPQTYLFPRLSPDHRRLAVSIIDQQTGNVDVWICVLARGTSTRFTFHPNTDIFPIWTPDGKKVTFASATSQESPELFWKPADGAGEKEQLAKMAYAQFPTCWSNDARLLLFTDENPDTKFDLWFLSLETRKPQVWLNTKFNETGAVFSPNGKWVAYQSDESGRYEVYVRTFGDLAGKEQISTEGGTEPLWAPDKHKLFYRNGDKMMSVEVETAPVFTAAKPELLFEGQFAISRIAANYDITNDGRRFLMIRSEKESVPTKLHVVLNWSEEVKRRIVGGNE